VPAHIIRIFKSGFEKFTEQTPLEKSFNPLKMQAGMVTMPDLKVTDQQHGIRTASFTTIASYLKQYDLLADELVITQ